MRDSAATLEGWGAGILLCRWMDFPQGFGTSRTPVQCPSHGPAQAVLDTAEGMELLLPAEPGPVPVAPDPVLPAQRSPCAAPLSLRHLCCGHVKPPPPLAGPAPLRAAPRCPLDAAAAFPAPPRQRFLSGRHCRGGR